MYCSVCGNQLQANQRACTQCGNAVPGTAPPVSQQQFSPQSASQQPIPQQPFAQQVRSSPSMAMPWAGSRVTRHMHTLGILWLVYAGWTLISWAVAATFLTGMFGAMGHQWGPFAHGGPMGPGGPFGSGFPFSHFVWLVPFITFIVIARSILSVLAAIGLLRRQRWGRTLAIVAAFLTLLKPITGTLLAIYTLWVLLPSDSAREFEELAG